MIVEGKINVGNVRVYPQLEDLEVTPNNQEQVFTHENSYGYDNVRVKAIDIQLQNKEVTPSKAVQTINADAGYTGLNEVVVNEIPNEYIIPTGTKEITSNGTTNIKEYENVNVNVTYTSEEKTVTPTKEVQNVTPTSADYLSKVVVNAIPDNYIEPTGTENITANGTYDITTKASVNVNVPSEEINLQEKSISVATNGSVEVTADSGYTALSKVNVSNTQELEQVSVTPTTEIQTITPSGNKLINQVNVSAVDSSIDSNIVASNIKNGVEILGVTGTLNEGITPSGNLDITENGTYDVTNYASANVNVEGSGGSSSGIKIEFQTYTPTENETTHTFTHNLGTVPDIIMIYWGCLPGFYSQNSPIGTLINAWGLKQDSTIFSNGKSRYARNFYNVSQSVGSDTSGCCSTSIDEGIDSTSTSIMLRNATSDSFMFDGSCFQPSFLGKGLTYYIILISGVN